MSQFLISPVLIFMIIFTIISIIGRFFKLWIISAISCFVAGSVLIIIIVTIGQFAGGDDVIRYLITSNYRLARTLTLTFGEILLLLILIFAFQLALAGHTLNVEKTFHERLSWFPQRSSHHYEMEDTLRRFFFKRREK